jgi:hypothetical protein
MAQRVAFTGTLTTKPSSGGTGAEGSISFALPGGGDAFESVLQREEFSIATAGAVGEAFQELELPSQVSQVAIIAKEQTEVRLRLNGAVASVIGGVGALGTVANLDAFDLTLDRAAAPTTVVFQTGDTTIGKIVARINATVGAIVASDDGTGKLKLVSQKTGNADAYAAGQQAGRIVLADSVGGTLAKLGLVAGTTYGKGDDIAIRRRLFLEPPTSGSKAVTKLELSGAARLVTHVAG